MVKKIDSKKEEEKIPKKEKAITKKKKSKINKKNIPSLKLKDEAEIAMDFAIKTYKRFDKVISFHREQIDRLNAKKDQDTRSLTSGLSKQIEILDKRIKTESEKALLKPSVSVARENIRITGIYERQKETLLRKIQEIQAMDITAKQKVKEAQKIFNAKSLDAAQKLFKAYRYC